MLLYVRMYVRIYVYRSICMTYVRICILFFPAHHEVKMERSKINLKQLPHSSGGGGGGGC